MIIPRGGVRAEFKSFFKVQKFVLVDRFAGA